MRTVAFLDLEAAHAELAEDLEPVLARVARSGRYLHGPEVERFECEFAEYCERSAAVGVANGLEAVQLTLEAMGIGRGDEVLLSAHTSIATWLAVAHTGAQPVPVEPDARTMVIDPACVENLVGPRTVAIVAVHLYGMPADLDALAAIAGRHGLALIEDASQAHGARLRGQPLGAVSSAAAFSLYPTKNLGALGDAGIVVADDGNLIDRIRVLANYGERTRHENVVQGHNSRLDEIQAAVLRIKLKRLDVWNQRRRERAAQYAERLGDSPGIALPVVTHGASPVWHQFVVRVDARDEVRESLGRKGVETLVHYPTPPHHSAAFAGGSFGPLPVTEGLASRVLSLPISPQLTQTDCAYVCESLLASVARDSEYAK